MPYYKYLLGEARDVYFHEPEHIEVTDELAYLQSRADTYENGGLIDMAQVQGLIYFESCRSCLVDHKAEPFITDECEFCYMLTHLLNVSGNIFNAN